MARPRPESAAGTWLSVQPVLDQELAALPDKYRSAIVLCDLEGKSLKDVARQLDCPLGTVGTRVARGRLLLARRLARRGVAVTSSVLAVMLAQNAASAAVPSTLIDATTKASSQYMAGSAVIEGSISVKVAALTAAVLNTLLLSRLKIALATLLALGAIAFAGASISQQIPPDYWHATVNLPKPDNERLQGKWELVSLELAGVHVSTDYLKKYGTLTFENNQFRGETSKSGTGTYTINAIHDPREIDFTANQSSELESLYRGAGIYKLEGRTLTICLPGPPVSTALRPTEFVSKNGEQWTKLIVLQRPQSEGCKCGS